MKKITQLKNLNEDDRFKLRISGYKGIILIKNLGSIKVRFNKNQDIKESMPIDSKNEIYIAPGTEVFKC